MRDDRLRINVTYDPGRGYVTTNGDVPTVRALSLGGLRKRIASALMPDEADVKLELDRAARIERDRRRSGCDPTATRPGSAARPALARRP
jgi:hypothetical protein